MNGVINLVGGDDGALLRHLLTSMHLKWSDSGMLNNAVFLHTKAADLFLKSKNLTKTQICFLDKLE